MKTVLDLNNIEAKTFFLKKESYSSFELPEYICFELLLQNLTKELSGKILKESTTELKPKDAEKIPIVIKKKSLMCLTTLILNSRTPFSKFVG